MSAERTASPAAGALELGDAVDRLSSISSTLMTSYEALARRAQHVEEELSRTNAELERKVAELDATKRNLEAILEALPTGVVVLDAAERVVRANGAALEILGLPEDALLGTRGPAELLDPDAQDAAREHARPDGRVRVVAARRSRVRATDGELEGVVWILDDRTEVTRLGERVHRMDKMAALGTMAGGIAHEIRNPMNAVRGFASLLRKHAEPGSREHRRASLVCEGVDEIDAIIASMLTFAEPERLRLETIDGPALVEDALRAVRRNLAGERWTLTADARALRFAGDRIKLRQALQNLVANAVDAQPEGGAVHVELDLADGDVVLTVTDDGTGIPPELLGRVLDPFFTTRAEGTGLGLALVHTIVRLHGGRFEIGPRPAPARGTRAVVRIPASASS